MKTRPESWRGALAALIFVVAPSALAATGDVSGNGCVDIDDVTTVLDHVVGKGAPLTAGQTTAANVITGAWSPGVDGFDALALIFAAAGRPEAGPFVSAAACSTGPTSCSSTSECKVGEFCNTGTTQCESAPKLEGSRCATDLDCECTQDLSCQAGLCAAGGRGVGCECANGLECQSGQCSAANVCEDASSGDGCANGEGVLSDTNNDGTLTLNDKCTLCSGKCAGPDFDGISEEPVKVGTALTCRCQVAPGRYINQADAYPPTSVRICDVDGDGWIRADAAEQLVIAPNPATEIPRWIIANNRCNRVKIAGFRLVSDPVAGAQTTDVLFASDPATTLAQLYGDVDKARYNKGEPEGLLDLVEPDTMDIATDEGKQLPQVPLSPTTRRYLQAAEVTPLTKLCSENVDMNGNGLPDPEESQYSIPSTDPSAAYLRYSKLMTRLSYFSELHTASTSAGQPEIAGNLLVIRERPRAQPGFPLSISASGVDEFWRTCRRQRAGRWPSSDSTEQNTKGMDYGWAWASSADADSPGMAHHSQFSCVTVSASAVADELSSRGTTTLQNDQLRFSDKLLRCTSSFASGVSSFTCGTATAETGKALWVAAGFRPHEVKNTGGSDRCVDNQDCESGICSAPANGKAGECQGSVLNLPFPLPAYDRGCVAECPTRVRKDVEHRLLNDALSGATTQVFSCSSDATRFGQAKCSWRGSTDVTVRGAEACRAELANGSAGCNCNGAGCDAPLPLNCGYCGLGERVYREGRVECQRPNAPLGLLMPDLPNGTSVYKAADASSPTCAPVLQRIRFVSPDGSNSNDCTRDAPCTTVAEALSKAIDGDVVVIDSGSESAPFSDAPQYYKGAPVTLKPGVSLVGGYHLFKPSGDPKPSPVWHRSRCFEAGIEGNTVDSSGRVVAVQTGPAVQNGAAVSAVSIDRLILTTQVAAPSWLLDTATKPSLVADFPASLPPDVGEQWDVSPKQSVEIKPAMSGSKPSMAVDQLRTPGLTSVAVLLSPGSPLTLRGYDTGTSHEWEATAAVPEAPGAGWQSVLVTTASAGKLTQKVTAEALTGSTVKRIARLVPVYDGAHAVPLVVNRGTVTLIDSRVDIGSSGSAGPLLPSSGTSVPATVAALASLKATAAGGSQIGALCAGGSAIFASGSSVTARAKSETGKGLGSGANGELVPAWGCSTGESCLKILGAQPEAPDGYYSVGVAGSQSWSWCPMEALRNGGRVYVAAGAFAQGNAATGRFFEVPTDYWIDAAEVTVADYKDCVTKGQCSVPASGAGCNYEVAARASHPVNCVTWNQARDYCRSVGGRLPTDAEWEKAARGSCGIVPGFNATDAYSATQATRDAARATCVAGTRVYPWGTSPPVCNGSDPLANCGAAGTRQAGQGLLSREPVGLSPSGAVDFVGNVSEWVEDYYAPIRGTHPAGPAGSASVTEHVYRGASYADVGAFVPLGAEERRFAAPSYQNPSLGFRCARDFSPSGDQAFWPKKYGPVTTAWEDDKDLITAKAFCAPGTLALGGSCSASEADGEVDGAKPSTEDAWTCIWNKAGRPKRLATVTAEVHCVTPTTLFATTVAKAKGTYTTSFSCPVGTQPVATVPAPPGGGIPQPACGANASSRTYTCTWEVESNLPTEVVLSQVPACEVETSAALTGTQSSTGGDGNGARIVVAQAVCPPYQLAVKGDCPTLAGTDVKKLTSGRSAMLTGPNAGFDAWTCRYLDDRPAASPELSLEAKAYCSEASARGIWDLSAFGPCKKIIDVCPVGTPAGTECFHCDDAPQPGDEKAGHWEP